MGILRDHWRPLALRAAVATDRCTRGRRPGERATGRWGRGVGGRRGTRPWGGEQARSIEQEAGVTFHAAPLEHVAILVAELATGDVARGARAIEAMAGYPRRERGGLVVPRLDER